METRKVQITGKSTYVVSLPKKWVNRVKISNGDSLVLMPLSNGNLLINPRATGQSGGNKGSVDIDVNALAFS